MMRIMKIMSVAAAFVCMLSLQCNQVSAVSQGTKGEELQIIQAEQLEIQLGKEWSGTEFSLETDAGMYPGVVTVDEQGVLRMEVGGSSKYVLSRLASAREETSVPTETGNEEDEQQVSTGDLTNVQDETAASEPEEAVTEGIPAVPLALFGGGMIAAVGTLVWISVCRKRRSLDDDEDDDV